jgi:hypothetical protein
MENGHIYESWNWNLLQFSHMVHSVTSFSK